MSRFAIAGLQLEVAAKDNRYLVQKEIEKTHRLFPWVQMMVVGELASFGTDKNFAQALPGEIEQFYCRIASDLGIWLCPGSVYERSGDRLYNTAFVVDPQGRVVGRYRKQFPFLPYEQGVTPGEDFLTWDVPDVGRFGLHICYDQWFPETTRELAWRGAEVIINPTMTNTADRPLELSLARANAISNQCYYFDVNVTGSLGNGRSLAIGPDGAILHQAGEGSEAFPVEIDLEHLRNCRQRGTLGLGQVLKSFRDSDVTFPVYGDDARHAGPLAELGPLEPAPRR